MPSPPSPSPWFDLVTRTGGFEPVGCHPEHRRRGLARALLCEGMRRLAALGATVAHVRSWWKGQGGTELYEAEGMPVACRNFYCPGE